MTTRGPASIRSSLPSRILAIALTAIILVASQLYYAYNQTFDSSTLLYGVLVPLLLGTFLLLATGQKVLFLGFFGIFWSVVDDAPIDFDSVLTWPQVTRYHPALPHFALEFILHVLTLVFILVAVRQALGQPLRARRGVLLPYSLAFLSAVASYLQNTPLASVQAYVAQSWYTLDVVEHVVAIVLFAVALVATRSPPNPQPRRGSSW